jgi:uncharacterized protein (DUF983 family)
MAEEFIRVSTLRAGLTCRCPRCGRGRLFSGFLTVAPVCAACGLDLSHHDSGDGPAVFVILVVGFAVVALALILETTFQPPTWLHMTIELPLILAGSLGLLRPFKATLVALQFRHRAREHRRDERPGE